MNWHLPAISRLLLALFVSLTFTAPLNLAAQQQPKPLAYLLKQVGQPPYGLWKTQPLQRRLIALLGPVEYKAFIGNLNPATDLALQDGILYVNGNAPHRGTEEEAILLVDPEKDSIEVFILHKASVVRGWAENNRLVTIPKDVQPTLSRWPQAEVVQTLNSMRQAARTSTPTTAPRAPGN